MQGWRDGGKQDGGKNIKKHKSHQKKNTLTRESGMDDQKQRDTRTRDTADPHTDTSTRIHIHIHIRIHIDTWMNLRLTMA